MQHFRRCRRQVTERPAGQSGQCIADRQDRRPGDSPWPVESGPTRRLDGVRMAGTAPEGSTKTGRGRDRRYETRESEWTFDSFLRGIALKDSSTGRTHISPRGETGRQER